MTTRFLPDSGPILATRLLKFEYYDLNRDRKDDEPSHPLPLIAAW